MCNNIQLNRVLPPGPREYWNELAAEHKNAPEHTKWMYDADPFAARREVDERQAKAAKKREEADANRAGSSSSSRHHQTPVSGEFAQAPEVRMASSLRDMVEEAVKKASITNHIRYMCLLKRTLLYRLRLCIQKQRATLSPPFCQKKMHPKSHNNSVTSDLNHPRSKMQ